MPDNGVAHHDLYHQNCYCYPGIKKLSKGHRAPQGVPVLLFLLLYSSLPSRKAKEGASTKTEQFGATRGSNTATWYNCQGAGIPVPGSIVQALRPAQQKPAVSPHTETHMADKLRSSASCLMLHFCLHLCCACRWALTPSPLSE